MWKKDQEIGADACARLRARIAPAAVSEAVDGLLIALEGSGYPNDLTDEGQAVPGRTLDAPAPPPVTMR
jgi:hypothetical protein